MRNWIFILIFSSLLGNMNAHQVQLVTHHKKTNGVLIRVVVSNVPEVDDIAGWVGQENWFYLTLNEAVFAENVLESLKASSPILEIEGIQNQQSVQIGFLMENYISDFEIFLRRLLLVLLEFDFFKVVKEFLLCLIIYICKLFVYKICHILQLNEELRWTFDNFISHFTFRLHVNIRLRIMQSLINGRLQNALSKNIILVLEIVIGLSDRQIDI